jgi:hypothetical protein
MDQQIGGKMKCVPQVIFLATVLSSASAVAETYRCIMNREIALGANGLFEDNKEANKGKEFFIAIDNRTQKGTFSSCTEAGCGNIAEVPMLSRYEPENSPSRMIRMIIGANGQLDQLWSLEGRKNPSDFTAVAVSAIAQRSDTSFGRCRLIIQ